MMIKLPLPELTTEHLILRKLSLRDIADVFEYAKSPLVGPNAGWAPHENIKETEDFIKYAIKKREFGQPGIYAIIHRAHNKMIGTIEVHSYKEYKGEIGFVLNPRYWGKGLIVEAAMAVIVYAFEVLKLERLQYGYFLFNKRSERVSQKLGFQFEGVLRSKFQNYDEKVIDEAVASIIKSDYTNGLLPWLNDFKKTLKVDYESN